MLINVTCRCFPVQFIMKNTNKTAVEIKYQLTTPVRECIYKYITS